MILLEAGNNMLFITVTILLVTVIISSSLFFLFQKRKLRRLRQQLLKEDYQQEILRSQTEARGNAINDLEKALDDHINQLTLVKINMNLLAGNGLDAANEKKLEDTKNMIKKAIGDIRMLSKTLNGDLYPLD